MKILIENELLEIIEAGTNQVIFDNYDDVGDEDEDEEDSDEIVVDAEERTYKIKLYKNTQSQNIDRTVKVKAANIHVQAINETSSILYLVNAQRQVVYCTAWEMVHSVDSEEATLLSPQ